MSGYVVTGFSLLALGLTLSAAHAAEGSASSLMTAPLSDSRTARYVDAHGDAASSQSESTLSGKRHSSAGQKTAARTKVFRAPNPTKSAHADHFYFYDASSLLLTDRDEDGYFSEFRIRFDADSNIGDALVYARLYLRRLGHTQWQLYHETDDFWVEGQSSSDDYFVTTTLNEGFATAEYEVLVDLYEVGFGDIVATLGPFDSGALSYLPLEEVDLDVPIELPGYRIDDITTTLLIDDDSDAHYSQFRISFDPDAQVDGSLIYAKVWVRAAGGAWIEEHTSEDFFVDASGEADVYSFTADWISGYPTSYYDVQIDLYESASGLLIASAGSERPELAEIPLEDAARDIRPSPPTIANGGGTMSYAWIVTLLALALLRGMRFGSVSE